MGIEWKIGYYYICVKCCVQVGIYSIRERERDKSIWFECHSQIMVALFYILSKKNFANHSIFDVKCHSF